MERSLQDRFRRERPRILSSLRQGHLQSVFPWDPDVLDQIYRQCWQECTAVATQLLASGSSTGLPHDEAGPSYSYNLLQPVLTSVPQQNRVNFSPLQVEHMLASQDYSSFCQPSDSIEPNHLYSNMGSTGLTSADCYAALEQLDAGDAGATFNFGFPPSYDFTGQNASSLDDSFFTHRSGPDHVLS
jgi:hypothetical protein